MRNVIGWTLIVAGAAGLAFAGWSAFQRLPQVSSLRASIEKRTEERRVVRDEISEVRLLAAGVRRSKEALADSLWQKERAAAFKQQQDYSNRIRSLGAKERLHTRMINLEKAELERATRALRVRAGAAGGAGVLLGVLGWILARRSVGA